MTGINLFMLMAMMLRLLGQTGAAEVIGNGPDLQWIRVGSGSFGTCCRGNAGYFGQGLNAIAADGKGGVFITGTYTGIARFGDVPLQGSDNSARFFLIHFDSDGRTDWVREGGGTVAEAYAAGFDLVVTPDGGVVVAGLARGPGMLGGAPYGGHRFPELNSEYREIYFIGKYSATGELLWGYLVRVTNDNAFPRLAQDPQGNIYMLGTFYKVVEFGNDVRLTSLGPLDPGDNSTANWRSSFVAKLRPNGAVEWVRRTSFGAAFDLIGADAGLAVDPEGGLYIAGGVYNPSTRFYVGSTENTLGGSSTYVAKLYPDGSGAWIRTLIATGEKLDDYAGTWLGMETGGNVVVRGINLKTAFLRKFNPRGDIVWDRDQDYTMAIHVEPSGHILSSAVFSPGEFKALTGRQVEVTNGDSDGQNTVVLRRRPDSTLEWARWFPNMFGVRGPISRRLAADSSGNVFIGGFCYEPVQYEGVVLRSFSPTAVTIDPDGGAFHTPNVTLFVAKHAFPKTNVPPLITLQPSDGTVFEGAAYSNLVTASSSSPLRYEWLFNDVPTGLTNPYYHVQAVGMTMNGTLSVRVANDFGIVTSRVARITILPVSRIGVVLNETRLDWRVGGDRSWEVDEAIARGPGGSLRTPYLFGGNSRYQESCWVETTVVGPGSLSWWWKTSVNPLTPAGLPDGGFKLLIDDKEAARAAGLTEWELRSVNLASGSHRIRWLWAIGGPGYENLCWLDQVAYVPASQSEIRLIDSQLTGSGGFQVNIQGPVGANYEFEGSSDLKHWLPIGRVAAGATGTASFTHSSAGTFEVHYYRAVLR